MPLVVVLVMKARHGLHAPCSTWASQHPAQQEPLQHTPVPAPPGSWQVARFCRVSLAHAPSWQVWQAGQWVQILPLVPQASSSARHARLPSQQPSGQLAASQTQTIPLQRWPFV
ncbi:MAG: hypothetical protein R2853_11035 [Thermomicrobiales bacterium]